MQRWLVLLVERFCDDQRTVDDKLKQEWLKEIP
jgi:hypothetical protein